MAPRLPSITWLQAFEATARNLSFTRAASELNLTQTAISHQIKKLEDHLGVQLFVRVANGIRLTEAAHEYLESARIAITEIVRASDRVADHERGDLLTIACPGTFAIKCLIPSLPDFRKQNSGISLRLRTISPSENRVQRGYDVAIQYGTGEWEGLPRHRICPEEIFPVCSPSLLAGPKKLQRPSDLKHHTLIRAVSPVIVWDEWPTWLEAAGCADLQFADEIACDLLYPSIQAAINGLGVVLGRSTMVQHDLEAGLLAEPFDLRLTSVASHYLVVSSAAQRSKASTVGRFRDWLLNYFDGFGARRS
jgi:LysR family transcriptional regulator, glycine cleavage system transcriptional activator